MSDFRNWADLFPPEIAEAMKAHCRAPRLVACSVCMDRPGGCPACHRGDRDRRRMELAGVPDEFLGIADFDIHPQYAKAVSDSRIAVLEGRSVLLVGPNGRGKTTVAVGTLLAMLRSGKRCRFVLAAWLVRRMHATYAPGARETVFSILEELAGEGGPDVLCLDDLGAEKVTEAIRADVTCLLTMRGLRPVIITTNYMPDGRTVPTMRNGRKVGEEYVEGLLDRYGSPFRSRLNRFEVIVVEGADLRKAAR